MLGMITLLIDCSIVNDDSYVDDDLLSDWREGKTEKYNSSQLLGPLLSYYVQFLGPWKYEKMDIEHNVWSRFFVRLRNTNVFEWLSHSLSTLRLFCLCTQSQKTTNRESHLILLELTEHSTFSLLRERHILACPRHHFDDRSSLVTSVKPG